MAEDRKMRMHSIVMEHRESLSATGVMDVLSFDEETIVTETELGVLIIQGNNLHVKTLNLENGNLQIEGDIINIGYEDVISYTKGKTGTFLSKIFR